MEEEQDEDFTFQMVLHDPPPPAADVDAWRRAEEPDHSGEATTMKLLQEKHV